MILKKLLVENLRSYETQEITFPSGSILLSGDIGSGKTTVLLAIEFALFGLQPSQKPASLLRTGVNEGRVILDFEIEGQEIIIERTLKRGKKSVSQDYCTITIDNDKFEGSVTEIKSKVLKLLNYPSEFAKKTNLLYKFTVYTPQEEMKQIILEPGDLRLNTLRHVFGIDKYKRIQENTSFFASKLREKIRVSEGMIYDLDENKLNLRKKQEELIDLKQNQKQASQDFEKAIEFRELKENSITEIQDKINEKRAYETEKIKSDALINEKKQQIDSFENTIKSLKNQVIEAKKISFNETEFNSINERINFQQKKEEEFQKDYIQVISNLNSQNAKKTETDNLSNKISRIERCPTCLQEVSEEYKSNISEKITKELQEIQKNISELAIKKNQLSEQIDTTKKIKEEFKQKRSELELLKIKLDNLKEKETRIYELESQKDSVYEDFGSLKQHITSIEKSIKDFERYDSIFELRNKELNEAKQKEKESAIKQAEINKEIQFLDNLIKEKKEQIDKKQQIKQKTEKIKELEYWITNKFLDLVLFTEKQVMITLKEEFSNLFSKWFSILVSESLIAKLDDDFSPVIEQQDYELDYSFLSGGERTAIALAYRLALNQVINSLLSNIKTRNLVILDEPTDGFSAQQLDKMRDVLAQLKTDQLILVSHEQKIEGFVDNIIRVRKDGGVTRIEDYTK